MGSKKLTRRAFFNASIASYLGIMYLSSAKDVSASASGTVDVSKVDHIAPSGIKQYRVEGRSYKDFENIILASRHNYYTMLVKHILIDDYNYKSDIYNSIKQSINNRIEFMSIDGLSYIDYELTIDIIGIWAGDKSASAIFSESVKLKLSGDPDSRAPRYSKEINYHMMSFSFENSSWKISYDDDRFGIEHNITRKNSDIEINPASSDIKKRIDQNTLQKSIYLLDNERKNSTNLVYSRELATQYAIAHGAQEGENGYHEFSYNCTNFISQCLWTGGWVEVAGYYRSNSGWWYSGGWPFYAAYPWHNAQYWYEFTDNTRRGERIYNIWDLWFGDILQYNWTKGYTMDHSAIVSYRSYTGVIYMTQHTPNYEGKPLSDVVAGDVDGDWNYFPWRMYVNYEM